MDSEVLDKLDLFKAVVEFNKVETSVRPYDKCEHLLRCAQLVTNMFAQIRVLMYVSLSLSLLLIFHYIKTFVFIIIIMTYECINMINERGADLLLPCIVFILVQSNVESPVAEFFFLYQFMETHCVHFEQYILQTFYSVIVSAPTLLDQLLLEQPFNN